MNNIEQKNVIYNLSVNSELPYQKANQVSLKANQIIYTAINHALDKMVDNDLYNEKAIFSNASYVQGPKPEADVDIAVKADGYKMWPTSISSPESDLSILHKNVLTLQQSLSAIELDGLASTSNVRVSSIVHGKPGYLVIAKYMSVGRWLGIAYVTTNINDPATLRRVDLDTGTGSHSWPLDAVEIDGTIYILMSNSVRKVTSSTFDGIETIETAIVIDGVSNPTSFEIHDGKYVVGNSTGLSTYLDDGTTLVRIVDENVAVNDIASVGEFALAATDKGIYKSDVKCTFQANEIVPDADVIPKFTYAFGSNVFVATNKGLYVLDGNSLTLIGSAVSVAAICEFNGKLYVGYEDNGGVSRVNIGSTIGKTTLSSVSIFDKLSIKGLASYNDGEMLVATVASDTINGIFYATPMLQKLYPIDATKNSTLATASGGDAFVANKNVVNQVSTTGATFFELVKNNEWNVKQFLDEYAIDDKYIYKQNSSGNYEKDTSFNVFSSNANGISKVLTIDGRDAYVIYGNSNETCIQAVIINGDGSRSILKYQKITNTNVISVFNFGKSIVIAVKDKPSSLYLIPTTTFFDVEKYSALTLNDAVVYSIDGEMTSITHNDHIFYVVDGKLFALKSINIGTLDGSPFKTGDILVDTAVNDFHFVQNSINSEQSYNIVCLQQKPGNGVSAVKCTWDSNADAYKSEMSKFAISFPTSVSDNPLAADIFDFLLVFNHADAADEPNNDHKYYGANFMGSHTFIAASSSTATAISGMSMIPSFKQLSDEDNYFAPIEDVASSLTKYSNLTYAFADCSLDPNFPRYSSQRQLDSNGNVARYEIIGNNQSLSALHLSPAYVQLPAMPSGMKIYKHWVMPLDRDFVWSTSISSYLKCVPNCADILFVADGTTNQGIWHLKSRDRSIPNINRPVKIFDTTENVIDAFSYKMSITDSCTYDIICYSDVGISTFQYYQQYIRNDNEYLLSTGNVKPAFSGNGIKHVSIENNDSMYVLSTYTYIDETTAETVTTNGIARIESKKAVILPALSAGINAFEVVQTSAIIASDTALCVIADIDKNSTAINIPDSDISQILNGNIYTSSKKFYKCSNKELSEFAVFYNNKDIVLWSNNDYDASKRYDLLSYTANNSIELLQLNEGRNNYLPSITYKDGNKFVAIQSEKINIENDSMRVDWKHGLVNIATANASNIKAYSYFNDVFFFGGSIAWSDTTSGTSKFFMPDYQLSSTTLGSLPSFADSTPVIRNIAINQRFEDETGNKDTDRACAQVFIATSNGLYYDYLSVGTSEGIIYNRKELSTFAPMLLSSDVGDLRQFSILSAADIQSVHVNGHTLYLIVNTGDSNFPYNVYSASLDVLDDTVNIDHEVKLVLEYLIPVGEVLKDTIIKLCNINNLTLTYLAYRKLDSVSKLYNINNSQYVTKTDFSSVLGRSASTVFQVEDVLFKVDGNGLSAISADGSSYTLAKVGSRNPGNVLTMSYSDDRFYASGSRGLSTFTIDNLDDLSSIPELADYSLCANNGLDAFSLSGELSGIYIPQTHPSLSVVSSLKFPNALSNIQLVNDAGIQYVYVTDANGVSSFQAVPKIQTQVPATYVFNGNKVKKMFSNNEFVQVDDSANSIVKTSNAQSLVKPCSDVNYIGDNLLFGADGSTPKAYRYWSTTDQLVFSKILGLPASYQFLSVGDDVMLVAGASGVSALDIEDAIAGRWSAAVSQTDISTSTQCLAIDQTNVDKWTGNVTPKVLAGTSTTILSSENAVDGYAKSNFLTLPSDVYSIFPVDSYTYFIGTDRNGLYFTSYKYELSDDFNTIPFSVIDQKIKDAYLASIKAHIEGYHQSDSSIAYINNDVMPVDASKISDTWQTIDLGNSSSPDLSTNYKVIENDIVESIDYGDAIQHIKVEYLNILTREYTTVYKDISTEMSTEISGKTPTGDISTEISTWISVTTLSELSVVDRFKEVDGVSYINKQWKSGLIDLFINIPTTNTYYSPHTTANDPCYYNTDKIKRKNFSGLIIGNDLSSGNIDDAATMFKVTLYKKYFGQINNIINLQLDAQTLPLKIYKDITYDDSYGNFFHSCIMPSIVLGQELYSDKIVIKCKCFGSDAQALHILADSYRVL